VSIAIVKAFWRKIFCSVKNWQNLRYFGGMRSECTFLFSGPSKDTSLGEMTLFEVLIVKISAGVLAVGGRKNPPKKTSRVT